MMQNNLKYYCVIYWYTTELNRHVHRVKNGSARRLASSPLEAAHIRIKEQITAKDSADPYEILHVEDVSNRCETGDESSSLSNLRSLEKTWLHAKQKELGMWVISDSDKSEWFHDPLKKSVDNVVDVGRRLLNEWSFKSSRKNTYQPHLFQQAAIDKAVNYFLSTGTDFLLDAVMRFGKSFTSYKIAEKLGAKRILVITGRPKVKDGWKDDLDHVDFEGWNFIDSQVEQNVSFYDDTQLFTLNDEPVAEVIFASFQGGKRNDSRIHRVIDQEVDLVIIDEAHAYFSTEAIDFVKNQIRAKYKLWVSGTPFKAYESGMFDGELDTYRFTILDLLHEKQRVESKIALGQKPDINELRYTEFPEVQFLVAEYPNFNKDELYKEESINMKALLSSKDHIANYPDEVNGLLDSLLRVNSRSPFTFGGREVRHPVNAQHVWMAVPAGKDDTTPLSVAAASVIEQAIKVHPLFGPRYNPISIRGDKDQEDINVHIANAKYHNKGSIQISCRSLNTGTRFPDIDTVVWLNETSSASEFWQTSGRALQPKLGKKSVTIICYSIEMVVNMASRMVEYSDKGQGHNKLMTEFLSMMPIYIQGGPQVKSLNIEDVYAQLSTQGSVTKSFGDREILSKDFDQIVANNIDFFTKIPDVTSDIDPGKITLHKSGIKGKNVITKRLEPFTQKEKDVIEESRKKVREFLRLTGSVMAASLLYDEILITSSKDLPNIQEKTIDGELYPGTKEILLRLIESGSLNVNILDKKISAFYNVELKNKIND